MKQEAGSAEIRIEQTIPEPETNRCVGYTFLKNKMDITASTTPFNQNTRAHIVN